MSIGFIDLGGRRYSPEDVPEECPICHISINPTFVERHGWMEFPSRVPHLEAVFQCPRRECQHLFIARYEVFEDGILQPPIPGMGSNLGRLRVAQVLPSTPKEMVVSPEVHTISPMFSAIYNQANAAEAFGLDQVAGMGYRKSLEFLIKDYCISTHPESATQIRSILLGKCIDQYVTDVRIKSSAKRAAWLGNDETHYERRWVDMDIKDLKILIQLTANWIQSEILLQKYEADMT